MNDSPHDHDRPGIAEQRAALAAARAMLTTAELGAAHQAAEAAMASGAGRTQPGPARPARRWPRPRSGSRSPSSSPPGWPASCWTPG